ncbi:DUF3597 domain-containing protein [Pseudomonas sp. 22-AL-CL-001]|uniref:DUF3597 domain-containing protein n=1 Tax=Pseudomonas alabamensis TaxID=3064349 RepID=UPI0027135B25|nr:DUF3597 domain-containing protein [Pseudomonas sp. 22-AL-CL-001]MDO7910956.1 DUF3597 domain-containing protein [Pseudomonas sp. 22-AL-CL-001]
MSLFGTILEKLGLRKHDQGTAPTASDTSTAGGGAAAPGASTTPGATASTSTPAPASLSQVDVAAKLDDLAAQHSEKLNWKTSIVDLLKLLNIDSSLTNRKELAKELNYTGSTDDSAAMNVWLHKAVLKKLSENGGQVPADLLD